VSPRRTSDAAAGAVGPSGWLDDQRHELARTQLLDAAARLFVEQGVAAVGMADVARAAGCSRATLYRYYANRDELRVAFVDREARRIGDEVAAAAADVGDPREQLVVAVLAALAAVRRDETLMAWFTADSAGVAVGAAHASGVIERLAATFLGPPDALDDDARLRSDWLVRSIVSLLVTPAPSSADERALVERFVAPVVAPRRSRR
jgi:AcrR family transcriptional regulator